MRTSVIVNMRSSGSHRHLRDLPELLRKHGIEAEITSVEDQETLEKRVRRLVREGAESILIGGGDGSMATAVDALAHSKTVLGVLPLGTGNSFAQTLAIGTELEPAIAAIAGGRIVNVDLGVVNGRHFANFATIGLSADIAANTPHALKPILGPAAYAIGGIGPFLRAHAFRAKVRWREGELKLRTVQMVVASGRFFGKTPVLPDATITDGKLAFFTTGGVSHFEIARMYVAFALGLQGRLPDVHSFSAPKLTVKTKRPEAISIDGNPGGTTPAKFSVAKGALRVFVPTAFEE